MSFGSISFMLATKNSPIYLLDFLLRRFFWLGNAQRRLLHKWSIVSDQKITVNILALGHSFHWRTTYWFTKWFRMKEKALMPNHLTFRFLIYFILQNCKKKIRLMLQHPVEQFVIWTWKNWKKKVLNQSHKKSPIYDLEKNVHKLVMYH